jgi:hypothetical protein
VRTSSVKAMTTYLSAFVAGALGTWDDLEPEVESAHLSAHRLSASHQGEAKVSAHFFSSNREPTADQLTPLERATEFIRSLRSGATERFMRAAAVLRPM